MRTLISQQRKQGTLHTHKHQIKESSFLFTATTGLAAVHEKSINVDTAQPCTWQHLLTKSPLYRFLHRPSSKIDHSSLLERVSLRPPTTLLCISPGSIDRGLATADTDVESLLCDVSQRLTLYTTGTHSIKCATKKKGCNAQEPLK